MQEEKTMRYVIVNGRVPRVNNHCALCASTLEASYLRELSTRIKYCGVGCYTEHVLSALQAIGGPHGQVLALSKA